MLSFPVLYAVGWLVFRFTGKPKQRLSADGHVIADYTVPHCNFAETAEGFKVTYRKVPPFIARSFAGRIEWQNNVLDSHRRRGGGASGIFIVIGLLLVLFLSITVGVFAWIWIYFFPTIIEATKESVIIKGKKFRRAEFGNFKIMETEQWISALRHPAHDAALWNLQHRLGTIDIEQVSCAAS